MTINATIISRRVALAAVAVTAGGFPLTSAQSPRDATDFSFLVGEWRVRHRKLKERLAGSTEWREFDGDCRDWNLLGGQGNVDDHFLDDPGGAYRAATLRRFDSAKKRWLLWWFDSRLSTLDPPLVGSFRDGTGTFFAEDTFDGRPIVVRFIWSGITPSVARWEQAFSPDGGTTWETNWTMDFARTA